jgi:translocation and assembly module TamA
MYRSLRRRGVYACAAALLLNPLLARAQTAGTPAAEGTLDPASPLDELPDLGVAWPDLGVAPEGSDPVSDARAEIRDDTHYSFRIEGLDDVGSDLFRQRFKELSALDTHDGEPSNAAQIDRRAREDTELLTTLLRAEGYYDPRIATRVEPQGGALVVTLEVEPGPLYRFTQVDVAGVTAAGDKADDLRAAFGVAENDPVNADTIAAAQAKLRAQAGAEGFPFARIGEPQIVIDHATRTATLDLSVQPGGEKKFGAIVSANDRVFDAEHIQEIARFHPGDPYNSADIDDLRRALVQTGLVSSVRVTPVQGADPETVDIAVALEPAPPRTIAGELGYGTGEGARAEVSWTHRNFFKPEGALTLRGVIGTKEQLGSVVFRRNNFWGRDRVLTLQSALAHVERDAYQADTFSVAGSIERQTNIFFQKKWTWSAGAELVASDERDVIATTGAPRRRNYFVGALPTSLTYDGSDDLLNPTRGFRLGGRVSPELSFVDDVFSYARIQFDASAYQPVTDKVVVAGRVRLGSIVGAPRDAVAPSRRFYAGGGASVRGYGYQDIGPRDPNNDPIGGRSLAEFSIEARVQAFGNFGIVPFLDGGNIYTGVTPKLSDFRYGAGIGVRYYTNFGPIRVDVGTPLNPQPGDPRVAVYVSLGQAF